MDCEGVGEDWAVGFAGIGDVAAEFGSLSLDSTVVCILDLGHFGGLEGGVTESC